MKKFLFLSLLSFNIFAGTIQNEDVKSESELITAGGTKAQLINDTKIYVTAGSLNKRLDEAIIAGDFASGTLERYSATEVTDGLWDGATLYKRCHTVTSDITATGTTVVTTWASGLNPKGIPRFFSDGVNFDLWTISNSGETGNVHHLRYNKVNGQVILQKTAASPWGLFTGSSFCMWYTK